MSGQNTVLRTATWALACFSCVAPCWPQTPAGEWTAPARAARQKNPIAASPESVKAGRVVYLGNCLACHGKLGKGDGPGAAALTTPPGDLSNPKVWLQSDGVLFWKITEGRAPMASYKTLLTDEKRWQVINYVRTLAPQPPLTQPACAAPQPLRQAISGVLTPSFTALAAMAAEEFAAAQAAVKSISDATARLASTKPDTLDPKSAGLWTELTGHLSESTGPLANAKDIDELRRAYSAFSSALVQVVRSFGHAESDPVIVLQCDQKIGGAQALWVQADVTPHNPYQSPKAPPCAMLVERIAAEPGAAPNPRAP